MLRCRLLTSYAACASARGGTQLLLTPNANRHFSRLQLAVAVSYGIVACLPEIDWIWNALFLAPAALQLFALLTRVQFFRFALSAGSIALLWSGLPFTAYVDRAGRGEYEFGALVACGATLVLLAFYQLIYFLFAPASARRITSP